MGDRNQKGRTPEPLGRKLHLPSGEWSYEIGRTGTRIRTPNCAKTTFISVEKLHGKPQEEALRIPTKPQTIKEYIEKHQGELV